jgi:hypothetical protein
MAAYSIVGAAEVALAFLCPEDAAHPTSKLLQERLAAFWEANERISKFHSLHSDKENQTNGNRTAAA